MKKITVNPKQTTNPTILKFETNEFITNYESFEFNNIDEAANSPFAQQLFHLPFVKKVYITSNFVAIERYNNVEWKDVQDDVAAQIEKHLNKGGVVLNVESNNKKIPVTIYAESTPNPNVLKFVVNKKLVQGHFEYTSIEDAKYSPLASELFNFPFIKSVFFDENYVSITKNDVTEWDDITIELREFIKSYIENDNLIISNNAPEKENYTSEKINRDFDKLDNTSKEIINILNQYVKPAVASDGGNIEFISYNETTKIVKVVLQGACSGCPSSTVTLKNGIENMLKEMLEDKIESVEAING